MPPDQQPAAPPAPRSRPRPVRRFMERLFLGSIMTVMALVLDRRLRRVFSKH